MSACALEDLEDLVDTLARSEATEEQLAAGAPSYHAAAFYWNRLVTLAQRPQVWALLEARPDVRRALEAQLDR